MNFLSEFLVLPGGADINPSLYGKKDYKCHGFYDSIDKVQIERYQNAVKEGRPIFGICRGQQLVAALNGLTLIQDLHQRYSGPGHLIKVKNLKTGRFNKEILVNHAHHQCVWTENKLEGKNFKVYGYCNLSRYHHYQEEEEIECKVEPEIMFFPKVKALTVQFHPEWMTKNSHWSETLQYLEDLAIHLKLI